MAAIADADLVERIGQGYIVESPEEMTDDYRKTLIHILTDALDQIRIRNGGHRKPSDMLRFLHERQKLRV